MLEVRKVNEVYAKVLTEDGIAAELSEHFTISVPGARFSPAFKNKWWDGKIRLFNRMTNEIYMGLVPHVVQFAENAGYRVLYANPSDFSPSEFSEKEALDFIATLKLPSKFEVRPYQLEGFIDAVRRRRALQVCPTASGKSLLIYLILMYYIKVRRLKSNLVIVPNKGLVKQLSSDFQEYGCDVEIQQIYFGTERTHLPIIITTWQTAKNLKKSWFAPFDLIVGDEAHSFTAKSLMGIMGSLENCMHRIGVSGSLNGSLSHAYTLEGIFGPIRTLASTKELQDAGYLAELEIKALMLQYPEDMRKWLRDEKKKLKNDPEAKTKGYQLERDFLINHARRNRFIKNLALSLHGNTLVLFRNKEHGKALYEVIKEAAKDRPVYFVDGDVDIDRREEIRHLMNKGDSSIAVVSYGTFATGINIIRLKNIIFGSPSKGRIRVLQTIGRGLRKGDDKTVATVFDIVDDLSWKGSKGAVYNNYMLEHFKERLTVYASEQFPYKLYTVALE